MTRKQERLSNRAARYRGECHFPRVVPETGLLRILGRFGRPANTKPAEPTNDGGHEPKRATASK